MGSITTGIGLISGIDTATLIDSLITLASGPKFNLQNRLAVLQSQQAALLDVNARLLNLKNTSAGLRTNNVFRSALATSGDGEVLTATPTGAAVQPGTYSFLVKQIVSNSQKISRGFTDADTTPVGLTSLSFELGKGKLSTDTDLGDLNAATGVRRGKIEITDSADDSAIIDLSAATTINEVLDAINSNTTVDVTASAEGDHLVITDNAGGAGDMEITDATGYFTATDLGINKTAVAGTITGDDIRTLGSLTPLSFLNDGTGVYLDDGSYDFKITTRSGREFDIDLGRINNPITGDTLIEDLNGGAGVTLNADSTEDIQFIDRDGVEHDVDLTGIVTVQDFIDRVNDQTDGAITITVHADGDKFTVTDTTGGAGKLKVLGAGPNETDTAEDLGILEETGVDAATFDGTALVNADHTPAAKTIQDVIDRINDAWDNEAVPVQNGGHIVASIAADGVSLQLQDTVGGGPAANFTVTASPTNAYAARDLGIEKTGDAGGIIDGDRLIAGINSVLVRSLNGGAGIGGDSNLIIQDRNGDGDAFVIDPDSSVTDIIDQINASAFIDVTASLNDAGNGLLITDNTGATISNLIVTGDVADDLGIDTGVLGVDADFYRGDNVQLRYVAEATNLADLNYGRGINLGQFRITDGHGDQVTIDVDSDLESVYDLIEQINTQAGIYDVDVTARVNDSGDGIQLDNDLGTGLIKVETISGTTAADLNLLGQAEAEGDPIDGTYETTIALNASDTIDEIVEAINDAGIPVTASTINTGAGATPIQMVLTSEITGTLGDLVIDDGGFGLGLATLSEARDAKVFFGSEDPALATLIKRSSNTLNNVVPGVSIDLVSASDTPVTLTVSRDTATIKDKIAEFAAAFNDAIGRIDQYDFYDIETEEKGPLLGNSTTAQVRNALFRTVQQRATGVATQFQYLSQVGLTVGGGGTLQFDRDKFQEAYDTDAEAVENLFTAFQGTTATTKEIEGAPGVTIEVNEQTYTKLGFGDLFDQLLTGLTDSLDGTVSLADDALQDQIDLTEARIEDYDERLEAKRARMEREFAAMEAALAQLQSQSNALLSLVNNLTLTQSLLAS
ncbi:MAG: flagellar filament capping protein FliD [Planctomycetota bacterium]|jgi:flagellar hook-associated protein 2